jgi:YD repeat-containing protein
VKVQDKDPSGAVWKTFFDDLGRATARVDPLNRTTTTTYDALHRVVRIDPPAGDFVTFTYNQAGQLASTTNARGAVTQYL